MLLTNLCNRRWTRAPADRSTPELAALAGHDRLDEDGSVARTVVIVLAPETLFSAAGPGWRVRFDDAPPASIALETFRSPAWREGMGGDVTPPLGCGVFDRNTSSRDDL